MSIPSAPVPHFSKPVSRIVCGSDFLYTGNPSEWFQALDAYWEAGGRTFDSAFGYGPNTPLLAAWATWRGVKDEMITFDKGCHPRRDVAKVLTAENTRFEILENHRRLGVDHTSFFTFHRDDPSVPVEEVVDWMNEIVQEGLVDAFGGSNWEHTRIAEANAYAQAHGKQGFSLNNPNLTLAENVKPLWAGCLTMGTDGRAWHTESQLPLFSWSSTARGYFAHTDDQEVIDSYDSPASRARRDRATSLGREKGLSATQIALAWVLNQPFPTFALCGLRTVENVKENAEAANVVLSADEVRWLELGD